MTERLESIRWARKLKMRHLEVLLVLCKLRSITAAANEMHMTQPAVSHWLADLEEVIGQALFVRGRQLSLTQAGEVLKRHAERMLGDVGRVNEELASIGMGMTGRLHIGSIISATPALLPQAIARVQAHSPQLRLQVSEATFDPLLERLRRRELDLIISPLHVNAIKSGFKSELLIEDTVSVVVRPGHPILALPTPRWSDVAQLPWVMPPADTLMRKQLEAAFHTAGIPVPVPRIEAASLVVIQMILRQGDYIGVLASSVIPVYRQMGLIEVVELTPCVDFGPIGMLWDAEAEDSKLLAFADALRTVAASLRGEVQSEDPNGPTISSA